MSTAVILKSRHIQGTSNGPHLLITGGVHGDEFEPMAAVRRLLETLSSEQLAGSVTLVPVVNEAAFLAGQRTAEDGLDLARVCPGKSDGSVTERTAHALSEHIRTADYYIDLHTGGSAYSVLPLVGYSLHENAEVLGQQREMARAFGLPIIWGTSSHPGRSLSVAYEANIPALYAEYLGGGDCSQAGIDAYVNGCLNVMGCLNMIDRRPRPAETDVIEVEDNRPGSGHMQVQNPSPQTGFFVPRVTLGMAVEPGDEIGRVRGVLGEPNAVVESTQSGIVLVLRVFRRVFKGESVGVILENSASQ